LLSLPEAGPIAVIFANAPGGRKAFAAHPELNDLWSRLDRRAQGDAGALIDPGA
jgi:hypothetical protein